MAQLDLVILNYNRGDLLRACLASVFASRTAHTLNVWVVDNASRDGSAELVEREFPQARLIRNPRNTGFAAGNNLALQQIIADPAQQRYRGRARRAGSPDRVC